MRYRLAVTSMLAVSCYGGQKFDVKIVDRQEGETGYSYVVPGNSQTNANANVNCSGTSTSTNCAGTATSNTSSTPAQVRSYSVTGATLTLELPDGRRAVVNCTSKVNLTEFSGALRCCGRCGWGDTCVRSARRRLPASTPRLLHPRASSAAP